MVTSLSRIAKQSKTLIIAYKVYNNWLMRRRFRSGIIQTSHGSSHKHKTPTESIRYIKEQFNDYLNYSGLAVQDLQGKRVLELGFGDNVGVALEFVSKGASPVVCLDKFYSERDSYHEISIYKVLRDTLNEEERTRFDEAIQLHPELKINSSILKCIHGMSLESATESLLNEGLRFDVIISRAVIEEIYDPDTVFLSMDKLLSPDGLMLHKIDLSDYGMFRDRGMNPLTFLTIPDTIYRLMASDSGVPNRKPMSYYRRQMARLGYDAQLLITDVIDRAGKGDLCPHKAQLKAGTDYSQSTLALVEDIRPRLTKSFKNLPTEELIVAGIFLIARKSHSG